MQKVIGWLAGAIVFLVVVGLCVDAQAAPSKTAKAITWSYDSAEYAKIEGFRVYYRDDDQENDYVDARRVGVVKGTETSTSPRYEWALVKDDFNKPDTETMCFRMTAWKIGTTGELESGFTNESCAPWILMPAVLNFAIEVE